MAGHWREVGTPTDYLEVMLFRLAGTTWIHPSAKVSAGASIRSSFVGRGTVVSDRAVIGESVVAEGALVGKGARVTRSVLLGAVEIAPKENVVGEIRAKPP
jgi:NDP-sugar pyrophosphorylase family protein